MVAAFEVFLIFFPRQGKHMDTSLSLYLLKHHPDTLRTYVNSGKIIVNSNGVFVIQGTEAEKELMEHVRLHMEWVLV